MEVLRAAVARTPLAWCIVGAGAVVDFEVPPDMIVAGNPARVCGSTERGT